MGRAQGTHLFTLLATVGAAGLFHIARPFAISAQTRASIPVEARVLPAEGSWTAEALQASMARALARGVTPDPALARATLGGAGIPGLLRSAAPGSGWIRETGREDRWGPMARREVGGVVAWTVYEGDGHGTCRVIVTVAHLGT